jgi:hypothetical protein
MRVKLSDAILCRIVDEDRPNIPESDRHAKITMVDAITNTESVRRIGIVLAETVAIKASNTDCEPIPTRNPLIGSLLGI